MPRKSSNFLELYGYDLLLASLGAFYVFMTPYTKVEESFNVQAMHDILYHRHRLEKYDHFEFPGVVPRTFIGPLLVSILASPVVLMMNLLHLPKVYSLYTVRLVLGCIILWTMRFFRLQIRKEFGHQVEAFFMLLTAFQFHMLFYCTRPLPNIFAFALVNLAYGYWLRGNFYVVLNCLVCLCIIINGLYCFMVSPIEFFSFSFFLLLWSLCFVIFSRWFHLQIEPANSFQIWKLSYEFLFSDGQIFAMVIFRCDMLLLASSIGLELSLVCISLSFFHIYYVFFYFLLIRKLRVLGFYHE